MSQADLSSLYVICPRNCVTAVEADISTRVLLSGYSEPNQPAGGCSISAKVRHVRCSEASTEPLTEHRRTHDSHFSKGTCSLHASNVVWVTVLTQCICRVSWHVTQENHYFPVETPVSPLVLRGDQGSCGVWPPTNCLFSCGAPLLGCHDPRHLRKNAGGNRSHEANNTVSWAISFDKVVKKIICSTEII